MFTGIVEELGRVSELTVTDGGGAARLAIDGPLVTSDASEGDSIAVNGVCLTVTGVRRPVFTVDVIRETLDRSCLAALQIGSLLNLERAMRPTGRLGGHIVQGHVDGTGEILAREPGDGWEKVTVSAPPDLARYVVEKGSVTVDGVSLTVVDAFDDRFTVSLIPTTLRLTTLGSKALGDPVNLEADVVAKYVERLLAGRRAES
ncbi:MAG: riboflavin synthase [Streptosporangiales bacterium]|nr:riboflavin synthase [Streptosporangiales bacterium]